MLHVLKRHPFAVTAFFRHSLVLTYAFPREVLQPLLAPGLVLDTYDAYGFLAIALVQTERLRPSFFPPLLGRDLLLTGYRIFVRLGNAASALRGLQIIRTDTNQRWMVNSGNLFTHYNYNLCQAQLAERPGEIEWAIRTPGKQADVQVRAWPADTPAPLPSGSLFLNESEARRFAGPLPYTFDYEPQTHSIIRIQGVRRNWNPVSIRAEVVEAAFFSHEPFCRATPLLANAFYVHHTNYQWLRGVRTPLNGTCTG